MCSIIADLRFPDHETVAASPSFGVGSIGIWGDGKAGISSEPKPRRGFKWVGGGVIGQLEMRAMKQGSQLLANK